MKRVELTTVPTPQKQKKVKWKQSTHRFVLNLGESNSETCPEYSFSDLVKNEKPVNGSFLDDDDDKDVAAIAQRFEAKYGTKKLYSGKRKRTQEMDDFYDPGEGYDEDDPFIDNTEAHDEVVPSVLTTQHGGFYINQGKLDFKCLDEDSSNEFNSIQVMRKKKKQKVLDSESDDETGAALAKKFKAMKRKRQLENRNGEKGKKKKKKFASVKDFELGLKQKKIKILDKLKLQNSAPDASSQKEAAPVTTPLLTSSPVVVSTVNKTLTTVTNGAVDSAESPEHGVNELAEVEEAMKEDSSSRSGDEGKGDNQSEKNILLPSQLPSELMEAIDNIKREAKEAKERKQFFSDDVNKLLLDIELRSRSLAWGSRTAIFNHLGEHLPCGKHTLQRRAKKLRESQEEGQLKVPIQKLKEAIIKVMPELEEQHELDVQKAKMESGSKEENTDGKEEASTESEGEEKSDNRKKPRSPWRKFKWNSEIRDLLLQIVSTKMRLFSICRSRNQTAEEYLKAFLDSDLKPLWPQGWMQTRMLYKESRKAHEDMTKGVLQQGKQRRPSTSMEPASSNLESVLPHMSKTEDVIEISSNVDSDEENNSIIDVNLPNSNVPNLGLVTSSSQVCSTSQPNLQPSSDSQMSKQSFKTTVASTAASATIILPQKLVDNSSNSSLKRVTPTPVLESPQMPAPRSIVAAKSLTSGFPPNAAPSSIAPRSIAQQMQSSTHQQNPQQHKLTVPQKSVIPQKMGNVMGQKLPQELHKVANMQQNKAAIRSSPSVVVSKETPNSSCANVSSVVTNSKSINPVVAVNRIPENHAQRLSLGSKNSNTTLQQNQMHVPQNQQQEKGSGSGLKSQPTYRKQQMSSVPNSFVTVSTSSDALIASKSEPVTQSITLSSKQEPQNRSIAPQHDGQQKTATLPNPQFKSGFVIGNSTNSVQKVSQQPHQSLKMGALPQQSNNTAPDLTSSAGNTRQLSTPDKLTPLTITVSKSPSSSTSPPSGISADLLNITSTSLSQSSTPSPQKSPVSPEGNAALSLYEQIKSQIWHQEAMEDQALKNLALAAKFGGSNTFSFLGK